MLFSYCSFLEEEEEEVIRTPAPATPASVLASLGGFVQLREAMMSNSFKFRNHQTPENY